MADTAEDANRYLQEGRLGKWTEDYRRLLSNYEKALALDPDNAEAQQAVRETRRLMRPVLKPQVAAHRDSEGLSMDSIGASTQWYPLPALRVHLRHAHVAFRQDERSADKESSHIRLNYRLLDPLALGFFYEYNDYDKAETNHAIHGDLYYQWTSQTAVYLAFTRQRLMDHEDPFAMYGWTLAGDIDAIFRDIHTNEYMVTLMHRWSADLRYLGSVTMGDHSDGNRKLSSYHEVDWRACEANGLRPELHARYAYFLLDYSKDTSSSYWSPPFFNNHAAVLEAGGVLSPRLTWMAESGLSLSEEGSGVGYRVNSKVELKLTDDWLLEGSAFYFLEPQQGRGNYWVRKFTAALSYRF